MRLEENNSGARERLPPARCDATERLRYKAQSPFSSPELERERGRDSYSMCDTPGSVARKCSLSFERDGASIPNTLSSFRFRSRNACMAFRLHWSRLGCHHPIQKRAPITNISSCFIKCSDGAPLSPQADYVDLTTITFTGGSIQISVTEGAVQLSHLLTLCDSDSDTWRGHHS